MVMNAEYQWGPVVVIPHKISMQYGHTYIWFSTKDSSSGWDHILYSVALSDWILK